MEFETKDVLIPEKINEFAKWMEEMEHVRCSNE